MEGKNYQYNERTKNPLRNLSWNEALKKELETRIAEHIKRTVEKEALVRSKVREWALRRASATPGKRPEHMNKLCRKQCSAIVKLRSRMILAKANHKNQHKDTICRFCKKEERKKPKGICSRNVIKYHGQENITSTTTTHSQTQT